MQSKSARPSVSRVLQSIGLLVLRVGVAGLLLSGHGLGKIIDFADMWGRFPDPIGLGSGASLILSLLAEVVCSLLVIFGLFTRLATLPIIINLAVVALFVTAGDPFAEKELALVYLVPFVTLFLTGPGWYSMDNLWRRKRRRRKAAVGQQQPALSPADQMPKMEPIQTGPDGLSGVDQSEDSAPVG